MLSKNASAPAPLSFSRRAALAASVLLHACALAALCLDAPAVPLWPRWSPDAFAFLAVSFAASLAFRLAAGRLLASAALLLLRLAAVLVLSFPLSSSTAAEAFLLCSLAGECVCAAASSRPGGGAFWGAAAAAAAGVLGAALRGPAFAWGEMQAGAGSGDRWLLFAAPAAAGALWAAMAGLEAAYERERADRLRLDGAVAQLSKANLDFQAYAATVEGLTQVVERKRISRDLHDTIGYMFSNMSMMIEAALVVLDRDTEKARDLLCRLRLAAKEALGEIRQDLRLVRSVEAEGADSGCAASVASLAKVFREATGIEVSVDFGNLPADLDRDLGLTLYRTIQEGLTNAFRHGRATAVTVGFWLSDGVLELVVRDNGNGSPDLTPGIGLTGMRERIENLRGTLGFESSPDGFSLRAKLPYPPERQSAPGA